MKTADSTRKAHKEARRTAKLRTLCQRLRIRCETSNKALKIVTDVLRDYAMSPEIKPILEALNNRN